MYLNVNSTNSVGGGQDRDHGGSIRGGDLEGDGDGTACTTPEIITSICNAYITLAASTPAAMQIGSSTISEQMSPQTLVMSGYNCDGSGMSLPLRQHRLGRHSPSPSPPPPLPLSMPISSIEATRTHLIKESLKVTIQCKRKLASNDQLCAPFSSSSISNDEYSNIKDELTPEDEERRRRRRERNKVAATKCRNKKKERTVTLLMESDSLEQTNSSLRTEIQKLEVEKQRLLEMLNYHIPACPLQSVQQQQHHHLHQQQPQQQQQQQQQQSDGQMVGSDGDVDDGFDVAQRPQPIVEGTRCGYVHEVHERGTWPSWGGFRSSMPHRTV